MCRHCLTPRDDEIQDLDSFDLAFLTLTGHVAWEDPFDHAFRLMKSANSHASDVALWGPEARLLYSKVSTAYERVILPILEKIRATIRLDGVVEVDIVRARELISKLKNSGEKFAKAAASPVSEVMGAIIESAETHFQNQRRMVVKQLDSAGWRAYLAEANSSHLEDYMRKFPESQLAPQIERAVALAETSASRRLIDRGIIGERLEKLDSYARGRLAEMSDVEAGLAWTGTGFGIAMENGVTHGIIQAEEDNRTCPVCLRMNGRKVNIGSSAGVLESVLSGHRRHRFPRVMEIDNMPPEDIEGMSLFPPFHARCRCDIGFLWTETRVDVGTRVPSPSTTELARAMEELKDFAVVSNGTSEEMVAAAELDSGKLITKYKQTLKLGDDAGAVIDETHGVGEDWLTVDGKMRSDNSVLHLHTHPDWSSFSDGDWAAFSWSPVGEMRVYTANKMEFRIVKTQKFMEVPWQKRTPKAMREAWNRHLEVWEQNLKDMPYTYFDEFAARLTHEINKEMAKEFGVEYVVIESEAPSVLALPLRAPAVQGTTPVSLLPKEFVIVTDKGDHAAMVRSLRRDGKDDAARLVEEYKLGKGREIIIQFDSAGEIESIAQLQQDLTRASKYRVVDMVGFGPDWEVSQFKLLKAYAKDAADRGRYEFAVSGEMGLNPTVMKKSGFKKSGKYWEMNGEAELRRFSGLPTAPRPLPPPPPPPPPVTGSTMVTATPEGVTVPLRSTSFTTRAEEQVREECYGFFAREIADDVRADLISCMTKALDHIGTEELLQMKARKVLLRLEGTRGSGDWLGSTRTIRLGYDPTAAGAKKFSAGTIAHEFAHAYDYLDGRGEYLTWLKRSGFGKLDEDDAKVFRLWWDEYVKGATKNSEGYIEASFLDAYEGRTYPGLPDGLEWWSMNSARYSHFVQKAREFEKELVDVLSKYPKGIPEDEVSKLPTTLRGWVRGDKDLSTLFHDFTRSTKWQQAVEQYGEEVTNIVRKAYNYTPINLETIPRPLIVKPAPVPVSTKLPKDVPAAWRDEVLRQHRYAIERTARRLGMSVDEALATVDAELKKMMKKSSCWIRRKNHFNDVMEDGRFKTQFETKTSNGCNDNDVRARFERKAGGYETHLDPKQRMVYGYISDDPDGMLGSLMSVDQYGEVAIRLKDSVRSRATFTYGDSLNNHSVSWDRVDEASHYALDEGMIETMLNPLTRRPQLNRYTDWRLDPTYWEAQYHWGLSTDEIAEVIFPIHRQRGSSFGSTIDEVKRHFKRAIDILDRKGIPYRFLDRQGVGWN